MSATNQTRNDGREVRAARRPELTADELQHLRWVLGGVLTLLGLGTIFYMDVDAWALMGLTAMATVATTLRPMLLGRVPRAVHTLAFPGIVAFFVGDLWLKGEVLPAMVRLDILLLLYRNLTYRQRRDDLQVVVLGLFLVVVAGVLTVSLTFAVHLLVYTGCALALLLVLTLSETGAAARGRADKGGRGAEAPAPTGAPAWAEKAALGQLWRRVRAVADWRVLGMGAVLFAGVVAVSALLFLAIPRFQLENSMFLDRLISKKAKSGFTDTISFGDVTEIQQDDSVALSVDVSDRSQIPAAPYWRMVPLDQYYNGRFQVSPSFRRWEFENERSAAMLRGYAPPKRGTPVTWTFFLEAGVSRYLPLIGQFEVMWFRETQSFRVAPRLATVMLREEPASMTAYRVEGFDMSGVLPDPKFAQEWRACEGDSVRAPRMQFWLTLRPADLALLKVAANEITEGAAVTAGEFARRAGAWLRQHHAYSLSPRVPPGDGDPLVRWLTSREAGHCELFAGSFVVLARAAGFPARVVTGFRGGTWNGYSNNFTIRNADAHAWAEIFDEQTGAWLRADPLAPEAGDQGAEVRGEAAIVSRLDRSWKARIDSLRVFWYRRIVSFDQRSQLETMKAVKEVTQNAGRQLRERLAEWVAAGKAWLAKPWDARRLSGLTAVVGAVAGAVWLWRRWGRAWWRELRSRGPAGKADPIRREAARWLARFSESGVAGADIDAARAEMQRVRFGARETWPEPEKAFRRARRAWRAARRQRVRVGT